MKRFRAVDDCSGSIHNGSMQSDEGISIIAATSVPISPTRDNIDSAHGPAQTPISAAERQVKTTVVPILVSPRFRRKASALDARLLPSPHRPSPLPRRDSFSTSASSDSSPTTTISTAGSSLSETSPPANFGRASAPIPSSSMSALHDQAILLQHDSDSSERAQSYPSLLGPTDRSYSPNKKMRNMKNLSVNTLASNRPATTQLPKLVMAGTAPLPSTQASSAPPTPSFIVPPRPPRRQPSNLGLTLTTPDSHSSSATSGHDRSSIPPPTPSHCRPNPLTLNPHARTSSLGSSTSSSASDTRMATFTFPTSHSASVGSTTLQNPSPATTHASAVTKQTLEHVKEEMDYDLPLSQEVKSPAYPQGPVCIYDPHVFLYLEPSAIEARAFDVVLNVAREVENPFDKNGQEQIKGTLTQTSEPPSTGIDVGVQVAMDATNTIAAMQNRPQSKDQSKTQNTKTHSNTPEYIHIPWDHNTNVVDDLLRLCKTIDERVRQNKRVLIHCQCGVSRSASLVVAYGLYRNPGKTVQEAYDVVKQKSRWIGPNMNLIYQLSEFKSKLSLTQRRNPRLDLEITGLETRDGVPKSAAAGAGQGVTMRALSCSSGDRRRLMDEEEREKNVPPASAVVPPSSFQSLGLGGGGVSASSQQANLKSKNGILDSSTSSPHSELNSKNGMADPSSSSLHIPTSSRNATGDVAISPCTVPLVYQWPVGIDSVLERDAARKKEGARRLDDCEDPKQKVEVLGREAKENDPLMDLSNADSEAKQSLRDALSDIEPENQPFVNTSSKAKPENQPSMDTLSNERPVEHKQPLADSSNSKSKDNHPFANTPSNQKDGQTPLHPAHDEICSPMSEDVHSFQNWPIPVSRDRDMPFEVRDTQSQCRDVQETKSLATHGDGSTNESTHSNPPKNENPPTKNPNMPQSIGFSSLLSRRQATNTTTSSCEDTMPTSQTLPLRPSTQSPLSGIMSSSQTSNTAHENSAGHQETRTNQQSNTTTAPNAHLNTRTSQTRTPISLQTGTIIPSLPLQHQQHETQPSDIAAMLLSPRAQELTTNPFHRSLGFPPTQTQISSNSEINPCSSEHVDESQCTRKDDKLETNDPRSPPVCGEMPIVQSIANVLD